MGRRRGRRRSRRAIRRSPPTRISAPARSARPSSPRRWSSCISMATSISIRRSSRSRPELQIDNAWEPADPVRVIHLLQHTAGFDDMHFNEIYNDPDPPELPLDAVLSLNPASRVVRWRPGTRMSYSNPGYAIAGYMIEKITGEKYEDRIAERIFKPSGMPTSSFYLTKDDEASLAKGYRDRTGPAGAVLADLSAARRESAHLAARARQLRARAAQLGRDGERSRDRSRIPQQHGASADDARLRRGAAQRIWQRHRQLVVEGFPMLGHGGGIDGFVSNYAYSTSRDVGFVVLLNSTHSAEAMRRIASWRCAISRPTSKLRRSRRRRSPKATLRSHEGYYHGANPRNQAAAFLEWLLSGRPSRSRAIGCRRSRYSDERET